MRVSQLRQLIGRRAFALAGACSIGALVGVIAGCTTIRVTDPARTADEEFLIRTAAAQAIDQLSFELLRDRPVYVESTYLTAMRETPDDVSFFLGEVRAKLLTSGVRICNKREDAQVILEIRSGGMSVNHLEYLLGIPALLLSTGGTGGGGTPINTPELSILKSTKQYGFASAAFVAYWRDSGELLYASGPFVGRTTRIDSWLFGIGPRTSGNIAPAQPGETPASTQPAQ